MWPAAESDAPNIPQARKGSDSPQDLFNEDGDLATPFRRLKLVMDYWCALWFWPIQKSADLPSREQWWMEIGAVLEGNVVDLTPQPQFDFALASDPQPELPGLASATQLSLLEEGQRARPTTRPVQTCTTDSASCASAGCAGISRV